MNEGEKFSLFPGVWYTYHVPEELESLELSDRKKVIKKGDFVTVYLEDNSIIGEVSKVYKQQLENRAGYFVRVHITPTRYTDLPIEQIEYRNYGKRGYYERR